MSQVQGASSQDELSEFLQEISSLECMMFRMVVATASCGLRIIARGIQCCWWWVFVTPNNRKTQSNQTQQPAHYNTLSSLPRKRLQNQDDPGVFASSTILEEFCIIMVFSHCHFPYRLIQTSVFWKSIWIFWIKHQNYFHTKLLQCYTWDLKILKWMDSL